MDFIENKCVFDGHEACEVLFRASDKNFATTTQLAEIAKCKVCGGIFPRVFPSASTLGDAYGDYYTSASGHRSSLLSQIVNVLRRDYNRRGVYNTPRTLLDYGCGSGKFLDFIHEKNAAIQLYGYDQFPPNDYKSDSFEYLTEHDLFKMRGKFDYITLGHVVEHLRDPVNVVKSLVDLLAPGGMIWISTPNAESSLIDEFGPWARDVDFPRHRFIFSETSLAQLFKFSDIDYQIFQGPKINHFLNARSCLANVWGEKTLTVRRKIAVSIKFGFSTLSSVIGNTNKSGAELIGVGIAPR